MEGRATFEEGQRTLKAILLLIDFHEIKYRKPPFFFFTLHVKKKCTDTDAAAGLLIPLLPMNNIWAIRGSRGAEATFPRLFTNICKRRSGDEGWRSRLEVSEWVRVRECVEVWGGAARSASLIREPCHILSSSSLGFAALAVIPPPGPPTHVIQFAHK